MIGSVHSSLGHFDGAIMGGSIMKDEQFAYDGICVILFFPFVIGVVEYLSTGGVETNHKDFKELRYNESLTNFSCNGKNGTTNGRITHGFKLKSAYENGLMPYTNYTFDFKVRGFISSCCFIFLTLFSFVL